MEKYFAYLDKLRDSGVTNMFQAVPYLMTMFHADDLTREQFRAILKAWVEARTNGKA